MLVLSSSLGGAGNIEPPVLRERQPLRSGPLAQNIPDLHYRVFKAFDNSHRLVCEVEEYSKPDRGESIGAWTYIRDCAVEFNIPG